MSSQGLYGALLQYWSVEPKARLDRRNTFFDDCQVSNSDAIRFCIVFVVLAMAIVSLWSLMGVLL